MNKYENRYQQIIEESRKNNKNVNIGIVALKSIYDKLTEEQKSDSDMLDMLFITQENLLNR